MLCVSAAFPDLDKKKKGINIKYRREIFSFLHIFVFSSEFKFLKRFKIRLRVFKYLFSWLVKIIKNNNNRIKINKLIRTHSSLWLSLEIPLLSLYF